MTIRQYDKRSVDGERMAREKKKYNHSHTIAVFFNERTKKKPHVSLVNRSSDNRRDKNQFIENKNNCCAQFIFARSRKNNVF